jgi:hypothetical protein
MKVEEGLCDNKKAIKGREESMSKDGNGSWILSKYIIYV